MTDRNRVGGVGGGNANTLGDRNAEDGFQKALGQSALAPAPVTALKPKPKGPAQPQQPLQARPQAPPPPKPVAQKTPSPAATRAQPEDVGAGRFSSLGDRLVEMRKTLGITQVELARRMGSTQPAMARIEKGEMKPNLRTLARYGEAIGQRVQVAFKSIAPNSTSNEPLATVTIDEVPDALGQVRRQIGMTQSQVAAAMDTSQPVIARLENGEAVPNLRTLERYCEAIRVEPSISFEAIEAVDSVI